MDDLAYVLFHMTEFLSVFLYFFLSFSLSLFPLFLYVFTFYILSYCFLLLFSSFKCLLFSIVSFCFRAYENWNKFLIWLVECWSLHFSYSKFIWIDFLKITFGKSFCLNTSSFLSFCNVSILDAEWKRNLEK